MNTTQKTTVTKLSRGGAGGVRAWRIRVDVATYDEAGLRIDRKQTNTTFHGTEQEAELHRLGLLINLGAAKRAAPRATVTTPEGVAQSVTVGQYATGWLERHLATIAPKGQTERGYRAMFRLYILPAFGHLSLAGLTREGILQAFTTLTQPTRGKPAGGNGHARSGRSGRAVGPRTIKHVWQQLKAVLTDAADAGLFDIKELRDIKRRLPAYDAQAEAKALDDAQTARLLRAAQAHVMGSVVRFALFTGARRGEICALRWQHVRLTEDGGEVSIVESVADDFSGTPWVKEPKSRASKRRITIDNTLAAELRVRRAAHQAECDQLGTQLADQRVFRNQYGNDLAPNVITASVRQLMIAAGLGEFSLHSLRHTHASTLLRNGASIRAVSQRLGHSDPAFTLRVYAWAQPAEDKMMAKIIEAALAA